MATFRYDEAIIERYPNVVGGMILVNGVINGPTSPELAAAYRDEQAATLQRLGKTPLSQVPALAAWRAAFRGFGVDPTQYRCAAEALLRRLTKAGSIPNLNTLVDLGNLVSIRYALPIAIVDLRAIPAGTTVRFARGDERFTNLGQSEPEVPAPGEVIFSDEGGLVTARRWCWRQSAESAARDDTTDILITIEAHHPEGRADVEVAMHDLSALLSVQGEAKIQSAVLDRANPAT
ncbi:MAG TPA: phenylalanine--tRNA ligase beta subunit-related protein, partial [Thermomicrobiales bacterium]